MNISKESYDFLENLRLYLNSSGKKEKEVEEIIDELEDHIQEAEKNGKNVKEIIGMTPKEYMKQVANEISFDYKGLIKYIPMLVLGAFSYILVGDAIHGEIKYSLLDLIGYPFIFILVLFLTAVLFKYVASNKISKMKEYLIFYFFSFIPIALFISLIVIDKYYKSPVVYFGTAGSVVAIVVSILVFIGLAIWNKTWVTIIFPIILFLPQILLNMTRLQEPTKSIIAFIFILLCVGIYARIVLRIEKNKEKRNY